MLNGPESFENVIDLEAYLELQDGYYDPELSTALNELFSPNTHPWELKAQTDEFVRRLEEQE